MITTKTYELLQSTWQDPMPEKPRRYPTTIILVRFLFSTLGRIFPKMAGKIAYKFFSTPMKRAKHKTSDTILETARLFEFMYGKQILKGYEWGNGSKTILLVHGWESRGTGLRTFVPKLVKAGFRVIAFDGPAHGDSSGKSTNLRHFAGAVTAAIHHIGAIYGIITHSFGGVSTTYALAHLDSKIAVEKIVFVAVPAKMQTVLDGAMRTLNVPPKAVEEFYKVIIGKLENVPFSETNIPNIQQKVKVKDVLIVHDQTDPIVKFDNAEAIYKSWDNAILLATKGYGHYRVMKNPDVVDRVCWFIHDELNMIA